MIRHAIGIVETLRIFAATAILSSPPVLISPLISMRTLPGALNLLDADEEQDR
ncbi:hypothetical protein [Brevibacterium aurantiacum]|uniref:hypothetical protein n=1 Tax=Brevibacterium aurantiacum TaxID=273384 RepID=UPI0015F095D2|nr:hypothetical protein [Brevibacterium aurantiacum]